MVTTTVNMHEAKTHLSKLMAKVENGEEVIIARAGKPIAKLIPVEPTPKLPRIGFLRGQFTVPDDIKTPFEEEVEMLFYGNSDKFKEV